MIPQTKAPKRRDYRLAAAASLIALVAGLGYLVKLMPGRGIEADSQPVAAARPGLSELALQKSPARPAVPEAPEPAKNEVQNNPELDKALKQAKSQIAAKKYDDAIRALNDVRPLAGQSAQAYLLLGKALQGKGDHATARDFIGRAIDLDPTHAEAYFAHAASSDALGDLESALGGMRSFLHLVKNNDPFRLQVAQARSAIWEWESKLGRGPWGPTKGIPPGFTEDQLKRDGRGTAIMMGRPETMRPDGTMDFEIKAGDRFPELWKK